VHPTRAIRRLLTSSLEGDTITDVQVAINFSDYPPRYSLSSDDLDNLWNVYLECDAEYFAAITSLNEDSYCWVDSFRASHLLVAARRVWEEFRAEIARNSILAGRYLYVIPKYLEDCVAALSESCLIHLENITLAREEGSLGHRRLDDLRLRLLGWCSCFTVRYNCSSIFATPSWPTPFVRG
jgi:hypothetical protein